MLQPLVALLSLALGQQPEAAAAQIPAAARQWLERNAKNLNGLEFTLTIERRFVADAAALPAELRSLGGKDFVAPEVDKVRIDGPRFYEKTRHESQRTRASEKTYNGRVLYSGRPPTANAGKEPMLTIDKVERCVAEAKRMSFPVRHFYWNYFAEAGYHLPEFPDEMGSASSSLVQQLAERGRVVSWVENAKTGLWEVVLEAPDPWSQLHLTPEQIKEAVAPLLGASKKYQEALLQRLVERAKSEPFRRYRLSLDPKLNLAMREKWETTTKGEMLSHSRGEDFFQVPERQVWLPKICRLRTYASETWPSYLSPTPLQEITARLTEVSPRTFSDQDFELWYDTPGSWVFDYTAEKATANKPVTYQVPGSPDALAKAAKSEPASSRTRGLVIFNSVILGVILLYLILRRRIETK